MKKKTRKKSNLVFRFIILGFLSFYCIANVPCYLIVISLINGLIIYTDRNYTSDMV